MARKHRLWLSLAVGAAAWCALMFAARIEPKHGRFYAGIGELIAMALLAVPIVQVALAFAAARWQRPGAALEALVHACTLGLVVIAVPWLARSVRERASEESRDQLTMALGPATAAAQQLSTHVLLEKVAAYTPRSHWPWDTPRAEEVAVYLTAVQRLELLIAQCPESADDVNTMLALARALARQDDYDAAITRVTSGCLRHRAAMLEQVGAGLGDAAVAERRSHPGSVPTIAGSLTYHDPSGTVCRGMYRPLKPLLTADEQSRVYQPGHAASTQCLRDLGYAMKSEE